MDRASRRALARRARPPARSRQVERRPRLRCDLRAICRGVAEAPRNGARDRRLAGREPSHVARLLPGRAHLRNRPSTLRGRAAWPADRGLHRGSSRRRFSGRGGRVDRPSRHRRPPWTAWSRTGLAPGRRAPRRRQAALALPFFEFEADHFGDSERFVNELKIREVEGAKAYVSIRLNRLKKREPTKRLAQHLPLNLLRGSEVVIDLIAASCHRS